jgi:hypothetical protein
MKLQNLVEAALITLLNGMQHQRSVNSANNVLLVQQKLLYGTQQRSCVNSVPKIRLFGIIKQKSVSLVAKNPLYGIL